MKRVTSVVAALLCALSLTACLGRSEEVEVPDLTGEWRQINSSNEGNYQGLYISDIGIEAYWILGSSDGAALYWAGTFTPPETWTEDTTTYEWESAADTSRTAMSLLTDKKKTKNFKYENGRLIYTVDYEGVTMTVYAEKEEWGYESLETTGSVDMYDVINGVYRNFIDQERSGGGETE